MASVPGNGEYLQLEIFMTQNIEMTLYPKRGTVIVGHFT